MKKALLAALLLVGFVSANVAYAANPYDFTWTLNDSMGSPYPFDMSSTFGSIDQHMIWINPSTGQPEPIRLQTGFDITSDAGGPFLEINNIQESQTQNLVRYTRFADKIRWTGATISV